MHEPSKASLHIYKLWHLHLITLEKVECAKRMIHQYILTDLKSWADSGCCVWGGGRPILCQNFPKPPRK